MVPPNIAILLFVTGKTDSRASGRGKKTVKSSHSFTFILYRSIVFPVGFNGIPPNTNM